MITYFFRTFLLINFAFTSLACISLTVFAQEKPQFKFKNLASEHQFGRTERIVQDQQGFIWIKPAEGLYKFDGLEYQLYTQGADENSLLSNSVYLIFLDSKGYLWISYSSGGVSRLDPRTDVFIHFPRLPKEKFSTPSQSNDENYVYSMAETADGGVWLGTERGLFKATLEGIGEASIAKIQNTPFDDQTIFSLEVDHSKRLWVASLNGLFFSSELMNEFNDATGNFKEIKLNTNGENNSILALTISKEGKLWLSTIYKGLFTVDLESFEVEKHYEDQVNWSVILTYTIKQDEKGRIWLATTNGLGLLESGNKEIYFYQHEPSIVTSINNNTVFDLFMDKQRNVWLATSSGVQILSPSSALFKTYYINKHVKGAVKEKEIGFIYFDKYDKLWLGGLNTGLYQKNNHELVDRGFDNFQEDDNSILQLETPDLLSFMIDSKGRYWFGTRRNGAIKITPNELGILDKKQAYKLLSVNQGSIGASVYNDIIFEDKRNQIWINNLDGLHFYDESEDQFFPIKGVKDSKTAIEQPTPRFNSLVENKNALILGTFEGELFYLDIEEKELKKIHLKIDNSSSKAINIFNNFLVHKERIWIATDVGIVKALVKNIDNRVGLIGKLYSQAGNAESNIGHVFADLANNDNLWLSTEKGVSTFHINTESFTNFAELSSVSAREFRDDCGAQDKKGDIYLCGDDGVIFFSPGDFSFDKKLPPSVKVTKFYLNNNPTDNDILSANISSVQKIVLTDQQSNFAFDFAALDYTAPLKNQYAYMLEGFDTDWISTAAKRRHANYSNIPAGEYIFKVKASNSQGIWNEEGTQIKITLLPSWYLTWWAKLFWTVFIGFILYGILRLRTQQLKLRSKALEIAVEKRTVQLEQAQKTIAAQEKMSSLGTLSAGIAHEINNPTNFVYGSCQNMEADLKQVLQFLHDLAGDDADDEVLAAFNERFAPLFGHVDVISEGAQRIKKIVAGLSAFSREDSDEMECTSIKQCIESTVELVNTEYKDITNFNLIFIDSPNVYCFPSKINQVLMNLLVNASQAIKLYSEQIKLEQGESSGEITVTTSADNSHCFIEVKDNGSGITKEHMSKIFEPFFTTKTVGEGTGLGLALSYEIIQQHSGDLTVKSEEGKGTSFTFSLPLVETTNEQSKKDEV